MNIYYFCLICYLLGVFLSTVIIAIANCKDPREKDDPDLHEKPIPSSVAWLSVAFLMFVLIVWIDFVWDSRIYNPMHKKIQKIMNEQYNRKHFTPKLRHYSYEKD